MSKKYRLKKDVSTFDVEAKAGCIGVEKKEDGTNDSKVWFDNGRFFYRLSTINTFPDWFELVEPERIEVGSVTQWNQTGVIGSGRYLKVDVDKFIPEDKFPVIKEAIEQVLNSTTHICKHCNAEVSEPDEKCYKAPPTIPAPESRDWEIECIKNIAQDEVYLKRGTDGYFRAKEHHGGSHQDTLLSMSHMAIHSVRRLSDNTVWTVGEYFKTEGRDMEYKIESFYFSSTEKKMRVSAGEIDCYFSSLQKLPPKPQPLFENIVKPPLGLMPECLHKEQRLSEIKAAVQRYLDVKKAIPIEWIAEQYSIELWLENKNESKQ